LAAFEQKAAELTERPGKRNAKGDLDFIEESWFPEIFAVAKETPIGGIGGPVATLGKYSIFYVIDKVPPALKDYLGVKRRIMEKLVAQQRADGFKQWVEERRKSTSVSIDDDALWTTVDRSKYATVDTTKG
jgi:parvulin-like peptidyl-prolyl isomerase